MAEELAGLLRTRIEVEEPAVAVGTDGTVTVTWKHYGSFWAAIIRTRSDAAQAQDRTGSRQTCSILLRQVALPADARIKLAGKHYRVTRVERTQPDRQVLQLEEV